MVWPTRSSFFPAGALLPATFKTYLADFYDQTVALLGSAGTPLAARAALGVGLTSCVRGLIGNVTAAAPLTKFDLFADSLVLRDSNSGTWAILGGGPHGRTVDLGLAGPAPGGRDQAAAFAANSWVNLFFIWNGTTLATVASLASHITGPTLPSGYTHWAYATTIRWNASSNIAPVFAKGSKVEYDAVTGGSNRALSGGSSTSFSAVALSSLVPTNALLVDLYFELLINHNAAGVAFRTSVRPTGTSTAGVTAALLATQVIGNGVHGTSRQWMPVGTSQQIDYIMSSAASTTTSLSIDVMGYSVPNGDV